MTVEALWQIGMMILVVFFLWMQQQSRMAAMQSAVLVKEIKQIAQSITYS